MVAVGAAFSIGSAVGGEYSSALGTAALFAALAVRLILFDLPLYRRQQEMRSGPNAES